MGKTSGKKLFQYKEENLKNAILSVKNGMKVKKVAELFQVPRSTLRNKLKNPCLESFGKVGPECVPKFKRI
jgi:DNA-binding NtrC family response regulator